MRSGRVKESVNNNNRRVEPADSSRDNPSRHSLSRSDSSNNYESYSQSYQSKEGQDANDRMNLGPPQLVRSTNDRRRYPSKQDLPASSFSPNVDVENLLEYSASRRRSTRKPSSSGSFSNKYSSPKSPRSNLHASIPSESGTFYQDRGEMAATHKNREEEELLLMYRKSEDHFETQDWQIQHHHSKSSNLGRRRREKGTAGAASNLPLAGAQTFIINIGNHKGPEQDVLATCLALGAKHPFHIPDATHALWCGGDINNNRINYQEVERCQYYNIPIVDAASWLGRISGLYRGQHWSDIDVSEYSPSWIQTISMSSQTSTQLPKNTHSSRRNSALHHSFSQSPSQQEQEDLRRAMELSMKCSKPTSDLPPPTYLRRKDNFLNHSISEHLEQTNKQQYSQEDKDLKLAMELSMLDLALVVQPQQRSNHLPSLSNNNDPPFVILGVDENATVEEIRIAFRKLARVTHPDKGGKPCEFERVARAYRCMLEKRQKCHDNSHHDGTKKKKYFVKNTAHWDMEIQDHWNLVQSLYQTHGSKIEDNLKNQQYALEKLGLRKKDAGANNHDENDRIIRNSCFYLSLASSYLHGLGTYIANFDALDDELTMDTAADDALTGETALQLKRMIEANVLKAHPEWAAKGMVGEEVQAFSDFIVYSLDSPMSIVADWAVVIFDTISGFVDIYKGKDYKEFSAGQKNSENTITIQYVSGDHYQALLPAQGRSRPSLAEIMAILDDATVYYVITDGAKSA